MPSRAHHSLSPYTDRKMLRLFIFQVELIRGNDSYPQRRRGPGLRMENRAGEPAANPNLLVKIKVFEISRFLSEVTD